VTIPTAAGASAPVAPFYPTVHSGPVLVCGFAQTFHDDYARARKLRPDAPVIATNKAGSAVKCLALFSLHCGPDKLGKWASQQREKFGPDFTVHSHGLPEAAERLKVRHPYVDHWWRDAKGVGTSTWAAAKMARLMGFTEIILCGMPLERMPYADGSFCRDFRNGEVLKIYRSYIKKDTEWHQGVKAMSGWTAKFFGVPE
jgi:hypothetical protein